MWNHPSESTAFQDSRPPTASFLGGGLPRFSINAQDAKRYTGVQLAVAGAETSSASRQSFAYMFTVAVLCLYSGPVVLALQLGLDPDVAYWIGRYGQIAGLIPIYILMMHLVILGQFAGEEKRCKKSIFAWTAVLPAVLLAVSGGLYMTSGRYWAGTLISEECSATYGAQKAELQKAYSEALGMYQDCRQNMVAANGGMEPRWRPTLQSCAEWARLAPADEGEAWRPYSARSSEAVRSFRKEFEYLASVEANHVCGGFCQPGPMLWNDYDVIGKQGTRCSPMVGNKFQIIARQGLQLLVISLTGISCFFFLWSLVDKQLKPFFNG
mmetsp:Transcript_50746/g.134083  ORF Transcript_50746/g.134083 Transcript_50746/m.134083 type:complete len:325 (-) Transcript_50746:42-1016(-)